METEHISALFLELSQFTAAKTKREIDLEERLAKRERQLWNMCTRLELKDRCVAGMSRSTLVSLVEILQPAAAAIVEELKK